MQRFESVQKLVGYLPFLGRALLFGAVLMLNANCGQSGVSNSNLAPVAASDGSAPPSAPTATPKPSFTPPLATPTSTPRVIPTASPTPTPRATPTPSATPTAMTVPFRVMTYNIKGIPCLNDSFVTDLGFQKCPLVDDIWTRADKERIADIVTNIQTLRADGGKDPDVIVFQEAWTVKNALFNDSYVRALPGLSGYPFIAWGPSAKIADGIEDYWNLINQDQDALKGLVGSGLLILSKYPILSQASVEYVSLCAIDDCNSNKSALIVKIQHPRGFTIDIVDTHLQAGAAYDQIRTQQAAVYTGFVQQHASSDFLILGGDFNSLMPLQPPAMKLIMGSLGVTHAGQACVASPATCQIPAGTDPAHVGGASLDHVLYRASGQNGVTVTQGWTPGWTFSGGPLSDHLPLIMDFNLIVKH